MITCRRAAGLISRELDAGLPLLPRAAVAYHTLMCGKCRRFRRQARAVDQAVEELFVTPAAGHPAVALPPAAREHLKAVVLDHLDGEA